MNSVCQPPDQLLVGTTQHLARNCPALSRTGCRNRLSTEGFASAHDSQGDDYSRFLRIVWLETFLSMKQQHQNNLGHCRHTDFKLTVIQELITLPGPSIIHRTEQPTFLQWNTYKSTRFVIPPCIPCIDVVR